MFVAGEKVLESYTVPVLLGDFPMASIFGLHYLFHACACSERM